MSRGLKLAWEDAKQEARIAAAVAAESQAKAARFTGMTDAALRDAVVEMRNTDRLGWAGMQELAEYEAELHRREAEHRTIYYPAALAA